MTQGPTVEHVRTLGRRWGWAAIALFAIAIGIDVAPVTDYAVLPPLGLAAYCYSQRKLYLGWLARDDAQARIEALERARTALKAKARR